MRKTDLTWRTDENKNKWEKLWDAMIEPLTASTYRVDVWFKVIFEMICRVSERASFTCASAVYLLLLLLFIT